MLNDVYFLVRDYENTHCEGRIFGQKSGIYFSVLLEEPDEGDLKKAYQFIHAQLIADVMLTVAISRCFNIELLEELSAFLFMPNYYRRENRYWINLICDDDELLGKVKERIFESSRMQGLENIGINALSAIDCQQEAMGVFTERRCLYFKDECVFIEAYDAMSALGIVRGQFFVRVDSSKLGKLYSEVGEINERAKGQFPRLFDLATEMERLRMENFSLNEQNILYANELESISSHLSVLQSTHEARELQEFYFKEYEILPLWYKRFGHVIKILMGKRTLRSLFSDKVKKYKY